MSKSTMLVRSCDCVSSYQDSKYGKGNRLHTISAKDAKQRCTVCGIRK